MTRPSHVADVAVIGLGAMGAMATWHISGRASVVAIEQYAIAHDKGSSHGGSRIFRKVLFEGHQYVSMAVAAETRWRELEVEAGSELLLTTGGLTIGPLNGALVQRAISSARAGDIPHELLDVGALRDHFPQHFVFDDDVAIYDHGGGVLRPEAAIQAAVSVAIRQGAVILEGTHVASISHARTGIVVNTSAGAVACRSVVVAAGPWTTSLIRDVELPLRIYRSWSSWFGAEARQDFQPATFPIFVRESRELMGWGIPDVDDRGPKICAHGFEEPRLTSAHQRLDQPSAVERARIEAFAQRAFPSLSKDTPSVMPCMDSVSPDGDFVIGCLPSHPNIVLLAGFSGHGFKHASAIGQIAADLSLDGKTRFAIDSFSPQRFFDKP